VFFAASILQIEAVIFILRLVQTYSLNRNISERTNFRPEQDLS